MHQPLLTEEFLHKLDGVRLSIHGAIRGRQAGEKNTREKGRSGEFVDFRPYTQGDETRNVDWNVYGRTEQLFIKEFSREADIPLLLAIDNSASMNYGNPSKLDMARRIAAALAYVGLSGSNTLRFLAAREGRPWVSPEFQGSQAVFSCFEALESIAPERGGSMSSAVNTLASDARQKAVMILISDLWEQEDLREVLKLLGGRGWALSLIHLLSSGEIEPVQSGLVRLEGSESGDVKRVFVDEPERRQYKALLDELRTGWSQFCHERQIGYAFLSSATPIEEAIFVRLREAGILK